MASVAVEGPSPSRDRRPSVATRGAVPERRMDGREPGPPCPATLRCRPRRGPRSHDRLRGHRRTRRQVQLRPLLRPRLGRPRTGSRIGRPGDVRTGLRHCGGRGPGRGLDPGRLHAGPAEARRQRHGSGPRRRCPLRASTTRSPTSVPTPPTEAGIPSACWVGPIPVDDPCRPPFPGTLRTGDSLFAMPELPEVQAHAERLTRRPSVAPRSRSSASVVHRPEDGHPRPRRRSDTIWAHCGAGASS